MQNGGMYVLHGSGIATAITNQITGFNAGSGSWASFATIPTFS